MGPMCCAGVRHLAVFPEKGGRLVDGVDVLAPPREEILCNCDVFQFN